MIFSHTLCHHSSTASFFQSSSASEPLAEHIPGRHLHVKTAKHKKLSSSYAPLRLHWISFAKVNSGWFTAITGVWEGLTCMTAALFTPMKCVRGGAGGLPQNFFAPSGLSLVQNKGEPLPWIRHWKTFLQLFLGILKPVSLRWEKDINCPA